MRERESEREMGRVRLIENERHREIERAKERER